MKRSVLIVDDEQDLLLLLKRSLTPDLRCEIETALSCEIALEMLSKKRFDLVLADIKMPKMDGIEFLEKIRPEYPELTVVMMTGYGQIDIAVEAIKKGAYDFITKPFDHDALVMRLEKALERSSLLEENYKLRRECGTGNALKQLIGSSQKMKTVFETIHMVAKTDMTVLITGESGTGKDLTAKAVHSLSNRHQGPFIPVNCPSVPETILESELFGYKKGAFTHAVKNSKGLFQEARQGSIFLDEIGDINTSIQTKLLRVMQEKEIKPLGDSRPVKVDVRIIASTNQDLKTKIKNKEFREDFYYRLNVFPIVLPPLRERREDIPLLANHLLEKHCDQMNKPLKTIAPDLMEALVNQPWEGNVRELENVVIRGILVAKSDEIGLGDIAKNLVPANDSLNDSEFKDLPYKEAKEQVLKHFNHSYIGSLLANCQGNVTHSAKACGLERQALQQIMKRYGISPDDYRNS